MYQAPFAMPRWCNSLPASTSAGPSSRKVGPGCRSINTDPDTRVHIDVLNPSNNQRGGSVVTNLLVRVQSRVGRWGRDVGPPAPTRTPNLTPGLRWTLRIPDIVNFTLATELYLEVPILSTEYKGSGSIPLKINPSASC